jgi:hypothetical protein
MKIRAIKSKESTNQILLFVTYESNDISMIFNLNIMYILNILLYLYKIIKV